MFSPQQYAAVRQGAGAADLSGRGRLQLTGADRRSYLQGLLTNDIEALTPGTGCYSAFLTPNGRMISDMRVLELGDGILLDLPGDAAAIVRDRLEQFVFSEDVQIRDVAESLAHFGLFGPEAAKVFAAALAGSRSSDEPVPSVELLDGMPVFANGRWGFADAPVFIARSDEFGLAGFDLFVDRERAQKLQRALLEAGATMIDPETLEVCRVEAGRPAFGVDMDETTIPLEAGIEDRAISQTKGCYVGQEIIIRVLHRGQGRVARRLVGLTFEREAPVPSAGDTVLSDDRGLGHVTSAVASPALERPIALAYVHRDFTAPDTAVTVAHAGRDFPARIVELPFLRA